VHIHTGALGATLLSGITKLQLSVHDNWLVEEGTMGTSSREQSWPWGPERGARWRSGGVC